MFHAYLKGVILAASENHVVNDLHACDWLLMG